MTAFFKHVGEHNGKKVIIVQRSIPGENHMAAIVYSQILPARYHDDVMAVLQSDEGQQSNEFMDIMNRRLLTNGNNMLVALVNEGYVKKVAANQIIVRPNANSSIKLDELVNLLHQAGQGKDAIRRLAELEKAQPKKPGPNDPIPARPQPQIQEPDFLDNTALAADRRTQAAKMRNDAEALLAEALRLDSEADALAPVSKPKPKKKAPASGRKVEA